MKKIIQTCDQCKTDIFKKPGLGYFELKFVGTTIAWPQLDFCGFDCICNYMAERQAESKKTLVRTNNV